MRGIGKGQTVTLMTPPEVSKLIKRELSLGRGVSEAEQPELQSGNLAQDLCDVVAWLLVNGMRSERTQANMLVCQNVGNVWKKRAYRNLLKLNDAALLAGGGNSSQLSVLLAAWKEETDSNIPNSIPQSCSLKKTLEKKVSDKKLSGLIKDLDDQKMVETIMNAEFEVSGNPHGVESDVAVELEGEQVQEQEQEQVYHAFNSLPL
jgi:hypothetical protein